MMRPEDFVPLLNGIRKRKQECFVVFTLDSGKRLIRRRIVFVGTLTGVLAHPREVFAPALHDRAASVTLAHNHPSGDPEPSSADISTTQSLIASGIILGIPVSDHIIVAGDVHLSFRQRGML